MEFFLKSPLSLSPPPFFFPFLVRAGALLPAPSLDGKRRRKAAYQFLPPVKASKEHKRVSEQVRSERKKPERLKFAASFLPFFVFLFPLFKILFHFLFFFFRRGVECVLIQKTKQKTNIIGSGGGEEVRELRRKKTLLFFFELERETSSIGVAMAPIAHPPAFYAKIAGICFVVRKC